MSELVKLISLNSIKNLQEISANSPTFTLHSFPIFRRACRIRNRKTARQRKINIHNNEAIKFEDLKDLISKHDHSCLNECRFIFQTLLSLRVANTFDLPTNATIINKTCRSCSDNSTCQFPTEACFHQIELKETKTTSIRLPILYQALGCFQKLNVRFNRNLEQKKYSKFLLRRFRSRTHLCRKFLPNFFMSYKPGFNTGGWSSNSNTMEKFYLSKAAKFIMLHVALGF